MVWQGNSKPAAVTSALEKVDFLRKNNYPRVLNVVNVFDVQNTSTNARPKTTCIYFLHFLNRNRQKSVH